MPSRLSLWIRTCFTVATLVLAAGCGSSSTPSAGQAAAGPALDIASAANEVAEGAGTVEKTVTTGNKGPVFVFEEFHTSRIGQLQIATMLVRLHDKFGMRKIGLEGMAQSAEALNAAWYRTAGGDAAQSEREDLAVRLVAEGEISSAELVTMEYPDVEVDGTEDAALYAQDLDVKGNPEVAYLIAIAEKSLSQEDIAKINQLIKAKKADAAFTLMMSADPWVKQHYEAAKGDNTVSTEKSVENIRELEAKAAAVGARIEDKDKQDIEKVSSFYQTASKRSDAMVSKIVEMVKAANGAPVAMIIGAGHSDKVVELLSQQSVKFALIQPADFNPKNGSLTVAQYERKVKGEWARNSKGTLGHVLNAQRKPPPVLERVAGHAYASMNLAGMLVAKAARAHQHVPDDIWPQLSSLPGIRIDKTSFSADGYDVIFRAWLKQDDGQEKEVWTRVGTIEHPTGMAPGTLESKLLKAANDLKTDSSGGGGRKGGDKDGGKDGGEEPPDRPKDSKPADNEGPGDAKKGDLVISRTGRDTLAVFGANKEEVKSAGRISY
jgi:hypothetical protein